MLSQITNDQELNNFFKYKYFIDFRFLRAHFKNKKTLLLRISEMIENIKRR